MSPAPERAALLLLLGLGAAGPIASSVARAGRPPEVLEQERREEGLALEYLVRKSDALARTLVERRSHLRHRLRAMYKMSQGGYMRLLLGADSPTDLFSRRNAAERILSRDIAELEAVHEELSDLRGLRERLRASERRSAALLLEAREAQRAGAGERVKFQRPVPGRVVLPFGAYRDATGLEFSRDGVELASRPGDPVFPIGPGAVRSVGEVPGLGMCVVIDHGDGWVSLLGHLKEVRVRLGARVPAIFPVAQAGGPSVQLQLGQGGTWVDPLLFL